MPNAMKRAAKLAASSVNVKSIKRQKKLSKTKTSRKKVKTDSEKTNGDTELVSSDAHKPLLSLGKLYQGTVLRRPSIHNKSP